MWYVVCGEMRGRGREGRGLEEEANGWLVGWLAGKEGVGWIDV